MRKLLPALPLLVAGFPAVAQTAPANPAAASATAEPSAALKARLDELPAVLAGTIPFVKYFAAAFRAQVSEAQFRTLARQLLEASGPIEGVEGLLATAPYAGTASLTFRDAIARVQIVVEPAAPHQVVGLLLSGVTARLGSMDAVAGAVKALPGSTGFAFARLTADGPSMLATHDADRPLAIGSAFKLVILAELVRTINAGERRWTDRVTLDGAPLPGGRYTLEPKGSEHTLEELATAMISVSDNSATDILLHALGRGRVEAMMPQIGIADAARNRPFLGTLEAFKLKGIDQGALARTYLAQDEAGRRALLAGEIAAAPISAIDPMLFRDGKPIHIDTLEWFASPADLVRVMDWLRRNTEGAGGSTARAILSRNPGIAPDAAGKWRYVGYKGGSEPGVMNMTLLLQGSGGDWYAITGSWNDPARDVSQGRFAGLITRASELAAPAAR